MGGGLLPTWLYLPGIEFLTQELEGLGEMRWFGFTDPHCFNGDLKGFFE